MDIGYRLFTIYRVMRRSLVVRSLCGWRAWTLWVLAADNTLRKPAAVAEPCMEHAADKTVEKQPPAPPPGKCCDGSEPASPQKSISPCSQCGEVICIQWVSGSEWVSECATAGQGPPNFIVDWPRLGFAYVKAFLTPDRSWWLGVNGSLLKSLHILWMCEVLAPPSLWEMSWAHTFVRPDWNRGSPQKQLYVSCGGRDFHVATAAYSGGRAFIVITRFPHVGSTDFRSRSIVFKNSFADLFFLFQNIL